MLQIPKVGSKVVAVESTVIQTLDKNDVSLKLTFDDGTMLHLGNEGFAKKCSCSTKEKKVNDLKKDIGKGIKLSDLIFEIDNYINSINKKSGK